MSTSSERARRVAAAANADNGAVINPAAGVVDPDANRAQRLAAAEAAATQAIEAARQVAAAQATANTAAALRVEMERQPRGSRSPARHRVPSPSPERCRGRGGRRESLAAIQTVYKVSGVGAPWPMLTKTNYHEWSLPMKVKI